MDPLSVGASVLAVVGAAQNASNSSLKFLKLVKNAPFELQDLINEVDQVKVVLDDVKNACEQGRSTNALRLSLEKAKDRLLELDRLIHYELVQANAEGTKVAKIAWATHQPKILRLRKELRHIRQDLALSLSAGTTSRLNEQQLMLTGLIARIESSTATQARLTDLLGNFRTLTVDPAPDSHGVSGSVLDGPTIERSHDETPLAITPHSRQVVFQTARRAASARKRPCRCICHRRKGFSNLRAMAIARWVGSLSVAYSGVSGSSAGCTIMSC